MNFNLYSYLFLICFLSLALNISCQKSNKFPELSPQLSDSVRVSEKSKLKYAGYYSAYLIATSKDTSIHADKDLQNEDYPWKVNLDKEKVNSFLDYLSHRLWAKKIYKSSFGEFSPIGAAYLPLDENKVMAKLLTCKLVKYNLTNTKGEKIIIDETDVSINGNLGSISFGLAKWDLQNQKIKGEVTLEITIPYKIDNIALKPADRSKTSKFGATKVDILEFENNVLHYSVQDYKDYELSILCDSCFTSKNYRELPQYVYSKFRMKPGLTYKQFIADSVYFELGKKLKKDPARVNVVYFESCDPKLINLYGYRRSDVLKKLITVPIDVEIN